MKLTRREFIQTTTLAAAGAVITTSVPAIAFDPDPDPRARAWELLDEARSHGTDTDEQTEKTVEVADRLFDHLDEHFSPQPEQYYSPFKEELIKEAGVMIRSGKDMRTYECSDPVFAIVVVKVALKNYRLPMVRSVNWPKFSEKFAEVVMRA